MLTIVPAEKQDDRNQSVPRQFDDNVAEHKRCPPICLGRSFTGFIQRALNDELRLDPVKTPVRRALLNLLSSDKHLGPANFYDQLDTATI